MMSLGFAVLLVPDPFVVVGWMNSCLLVQYSYYLFTEVPKGILH